MDVGLIHASVEVTKPVNAALTVEPSETRDASDDDSGCRGILFAALLVPFIWLFIAILYLILRG